MADLQQLVSALQRADAAGDEQAAGVIAKAIRREKLKIDQPGDYDPSSSAYQAKYGATSDTAGNNFMAGAGKAVVDMGRGVQQVGAGIGNKLGLVSDDTVAGIQNNIDNAAERDRPLMESGAGLAGNIAGNLATIAVPGSVAARGAQAAKLGRTANAFRGLVNPNSYKAAVAGGAAYGALSPVETGGSRMTNTAIGAGSGLVGQGAVRGLGRVAEPIKNVGGAAVDKLKAAGIPLDLAQKTGSTLLQRLKTGLNANPLTAGGQREVGQAQQRAFTKAALKTIGADSAEASQPVMSAAKRDIGKIYDDIAARNPVDFDNELQTGIAKLVNEANKELNDSQMRVLGNNIDSILDKAAAGKIDGKAFQNIKKTLDRVSRGADSTLGFYARGLRDELLEALKRGATDADQALLKKANTQWANLKTIEGAIDKGGEGLISPLRVSGALGTKANRWRSVYGGGDQELVDLAQSARNVLPEKLPDSGTAGRVMAGSMMVGGAGGLSAISPENSDKFALAAALAYGGPKAVQAILNKSPRYLAEGLQTPALRALLKAPQGQGITGTLSKKAALASALSANSSGR